MMNKDQIAEELAQARGACEEARTRRDKLVVQALAVGVPVAEVARLAGVSISSVHRIRRASQS